MLNLRPALNPPALNPPALKTQPSKTPALKSLPDLACAGLLAPDQIATLAPVAARYAVALTPAIADLIDPSDPNDPIARQFVPSIDELVHRPEELVDPIGDARHSPVPGIVHRHSDRVLFKLTHICPVYCRFCFRREMVGPDNNPGLGKQEIETALRYIADHREIWEVILTGGDPFVLAPRRIGDIISRLNEIPHVKILRWHTRVPIADPDAINDELVQALKRSRKTTYVVVHANHPRELSARARAACRRILDSGIALLSQSVLLRGVNDTIETLESLMRALVETGITPYYLHHADLAPGTSQFRTTIAAGRALMEALHARASGLCQPTYVLDLPGGHSKARLETGDAECVAEGAPGAPASYRIRDGQNRRHRYCESLPSPK